MSSREGLCFPCYKCCLKNSAKEEETEREEDREGLLDRPENTSVEIPAGSAEGNSSHISNLTVDNSGSITGNETGGPANIHELNEILKKKIRYIFREYITSTNILYVFHKYNVAVLNESDIIDVKYKMKRHGPIEGANLLLDRLVVYKGWFHCLIQVLKDPKVRLLPAAEQLEKIQDELCIKYPQCIKLTEDVSAGESLITADNPNKDKGQNRNTRYIPSEVNIFQEIIAEARQDNKIMVEEIIRLNDLKTELHQSLKSKDIQVEKMANGNEELTLQLLKSREETQTLMQQIDYLSLMLQASHEEIEKLEQLKDLVCDSCKRKREIKLSIEDNDKQNTVQRNVQSKKLDNWWKLVYPPDEDPSETTETRTNSQSND